MTRFERVRGDLLDAVVIGDRARALRALKSSLRWKHARSREVRDLHDVAIEKWPDLFARVP